jgi:hypothetical protein
MLAAEPALHLTRGRLVARAHQDAHLGPEQL